MLPTPRTPQSATQKGPTQLPTEHMRMTHCQCQCAVGFCTRTPRCAQCTNRKLATLYNQIHGFSASTSASSSKAISRQRSAPGQSNGCPDHQNLAIPTTMSGPRPCCFQGYRSPPAMCPPMAPHDSLATQCGHTPKYCSMASR